LGKKRPSTSGGELNERPRKAAIREGTTATESRENHLPYQGEMGREREFRGSWRNLRETLRELKVNLRIG